MYIKGKPEKNVKKVISEIQKNIYEPKKLQTLLQKTHRASNVSKQSSQNIWPNIW